MIQLAQMKIQLALVQKQLAFWTQLAIILGTAVVNAIKDTRVVGHNSALVPGIKD